MQVPGSERTLAVQIHQRQIGVHAFGQGPFAGDV